MRTLTFLIVNIAFQNKSHPLSEQMEIRPRNLSLKLALSQLTKMKKMKKTFTAKLLMFLLTILRNFILGILKPIPLSHISLAVFLC